MAPITRTSGTAGRGTTMTVMPPEPGFGPLGARTCHPSRAPTTRALVLHNPGLDGPAATPTIAATRGHAEPPEPGDRQLGPGRGPGFGDLAMRWRDLRTPR